MRNDYASKYQVVTRPFQESHFDETTKLDKVPGWEAGRLESLQHGE